MYMLGRLQSNLCRSRFYSKKAKIEFSEAKRTLSDHSRSSGYRTPVKPIIITESLSRQL